MDELRNVLGRFEKEGAALGHFNVADLILLKAVLAAADENRVPVLVGASEGERDFIGRGCNARSGLTRFTPGQQPGRVRLWRNR